MKISKNVRKRGAVQLARLRAFDRDECGQDLIEYGLVASLIALLALVSVRGLGTTVSSFFTNFLYRVYLAFTGG